MAARRREPRRGPFLGEMAKTLARFRATAFLRVASVRTFGTFPARHQNFPIA